MITDQLYQEYLDLLLDGKRVACSRIIHELIEQDIEIKTLYMELFQKSLYAIGRLWELNKITVAKEHLVTAITEGLLNLVYPRLFEKDVLNKNKKVVISCAANEFHQIGGKMVADIFELNGWDGHFLGANTSVEHMLEYVQDIKPDLVGLSISVYFNMPSLKTGIEAIRSNFSNLDILVGGQAFNWGGKDMLRHYSGITYASSLDGLNTIIKG